MATHYTDTNAADRQTAAQIAHSLAKGSYQRKRLEGGVWSGADLKGTARRWGDRYKASRENLIDRLERHPLLRCEVVYAKHGERIVKFGLARACVALECVVELTLVSPA
jgi:hypothetical protein